MRANPEQYKAINHEGGVLLKAGAGSGKTYVLVEHIFHLIDDFFTKNKSSDLVEIQNKLGSFLSSIVLLTFTKKAAGELSSRLLKKITKEFESSPESEIWKWNLVKESFSYLNVGTIHGFCFKLISGGFFPNLNPEIDMYNEVQIEGRIHSLFQIWAERVLKDKNILLKETVLSHQKEIEAAFLMIFNSPELRQMWREFDFEEDFTLDEDKYLRELLIANDLEVLLAAPLDLSSLGDFKDKKWFLILEGFVSLNRSKPINSFSHLDSYHEYFDSIKTMRGPTKGKVEEKVSEYFSSIALFRDLIRSIKDDFDVFYEHQNAAFKDWNNKLKEGFHFINEEYEEYNGFSFTDLEYYTLLGLKDDGNKERVTKIFKYFIIDEFQDTSFFQLEIIKKLINGDYNNLFCVGDIKQAIYGFRGGEIGVFRETEENTPINLTLENNYRSSENLISFYNDLFKDIFSRSFKFKGHDPLAVEATPQHYPEEKNEEFKGDITQINYYISSKDPKPKIGSKEMDFFEAKAIIDEIIKRRNSHPDSEICILYKNLGPSKFLITQLLNKEISFTAQVKVPLEEDPIIGIFKILVETLILQRASQSGNQDLNYPVKLINSYLDHLHFPKEKNLVKKINQFFEDISLFGLFEAFKKLLFTLRMANSNYHNNLEQIGAICRISRQNVDTAWEILDRRKENKYSLDFEYGDSPQSLRIMTTHASKGLEFEHVILGGIHTNGRGVPDGSFLGVMPGSFKWKLNSFQKKPFKSPNYWLEHFIRKKKDFSESKRLFYVACTRAEKSLTMVNLLLNNKEVLYSDNSWIKGIRVFNSTQEDQIKISLDSESLNIEDGLKEKESLPHNRPLFHQDPSGILPKFHGDNEGSQENPLLNISEMSVTKMSYIADCPRKFYLENICKIENEKLSETLQEYFEDAPEFKKKPANNEKIETSLSSTERGTRIHLKISKMIKNDLVQGSDSDSSDDFHALDFAKSELSKWEEDFSFISEELIKFSFFGQMISGTPDLLVSPKTNGIFKILDFKTGKRKNDEDSYWFQLYSYALASYELGNLSKENPIELSLMYLDEKESFTKQLNYNEVTEFLYGYWLKLERLDQVNENHCSHCNFEKLCQTIVVS